ncbi:MAG: hypothetical protein HOV96_23175 [Nonomuraea sp.]|nr:hypothetical protein [Nonomuraea sp.]NUP63851.1 hypothetical protein [Nonomuraea sp.]NUP80449.1 hypothetical protein [Nonomuraea sp.]NUS04420.1 hypothetical protein [Nonomuraea sp.]NUT12533.1 hypothetical protein [Nonomuraea sp.]
MTMSPKIAGFLVILGVFMIVEWINLGFNLADGHPTGFYVVHGILIVVNVILGLVLAGIGWRGLRQAGVRRRRAGAE